MRWLIVVAMLLSLRSWGEGLSLPLLQDAKEYWKLYSRGNDDPEEFDEAGTSNFETATVRGTIIAGTNEKDEISVFILFYAHLVGDNFGTMWAQSLSAMPGLKLRPIIERDKYPEDPAGSTVRLTLTSGPGGRPRDGSLSGMAWLGNIQKPNGDYEGKVVVDMAPADDYKDGYQHENIFWKVSVKDGKVASVSIDVKEVDQEGKRPAKDIIRLIRTSDSPKVLAESFPTRVGRARRISKEQRLGKQGE